MKEKEKKKLKCGSLPTADIVGAAGKIKSYINRTNISETVKKIY